MIVTAMPAALAWLVIDVLLDASDIVVGVQVDMIVCHAGAGGRNCLSSEL